MITVHTNTYNEERIIEYFINHYRENFPNCIIKIYDNYSTDNTVKIAEQYGCEIHYYDSGNKFCDDTMLNIRNNCWKNANTDWVIMCDTDELVYISQEELSKQEELGFNIIQPTGYTIINKDDSITDLKEMKYGYRDTPYDKCVIFNKKYISEINFNHGSHQINPVGSYININQNQFKLIHYKWIGKKYTTERRNMLKNRGISDFNAKRNFSAEYVFDEESFPSYIEYAKIDNVYSRNDLIKVI